MVNQPYSLATINFPLTGPDVYFSPLVPISGSPVPVSFRDSTNFILEGNVASAAPVPDGSDNIIVSFIDDIGMAVCVIEIIRLTSQITVRSDYNVRSTEMARGKGVVGVIPKLVVHIYRPSSCLSPPASMQENRFVLS
jgi:hypothetical protein